MKAYIFQAALLCEDCANDVKAQTPPPHGVDPQNPDESLYDSDDWPKGPYGEGGGEADTPCHCDHCGVFLENPLTPDGSAYVKALWRNFTHDGRGRLDVLQAWRDEYPCEWAEFCQEMEAEAEAANVSDLMQRRWDDLSGTPWAA